jgi:hypothetical protein
MGWYSTPFNYDGTSPTQVRDDLQKANENFQALSDVFENGTPLSGRIKSSYISGGGGNISGDIIVNSVTVSNPNRVNIGIDLSASTNGFYQAAIKMPVGVPGSMIGWIPATGTWGGDSLVGVNTSGEFWVIGRPGSDGRKRVWVRDDLYVIGSIIPGSIQVLPTSSQPYALNLRSSVGFTQGCILMPTGGIGSQITWGDPPDAHSLIGVQSTGKFIIRGRPDNSGRNQIHMEDDVNISGNLTVNGSVNITFPSLVTFQKIIISASSGQDYGIKIVNSGDFAQSAIILPVGGSGSSIAWIPAYQGSNPWGTDSLIGVNRSGQFWIRGRGDIYGNNKTVYVSDDIKISRDLIVDRNGSISGSLNVGGISIYNDSSDGRAKIVGTPSPGNQGRNTLYVYSDFSVVGEAWVNGKIHVATSTDTAGITFRDVADTCNYSEAAIWMPRYGNGNYISWNPYSIADYNYGLIGRREHDGHFVIVGLPSGVAGSDANVYMYDNVIVYKTLYATSVVQTCDLSLKENVVVLADSALDLVKKIDVYEYSLKSDPGVRHVGFVANYVKDIFPHGVTVNGDGMCSINILDMLALLFKAVKELAEHVANN